LILDIKPTTVSVDGVSERENAEMPQIFEKIFVYVSTETW